MFLFKNRLGIYYISYIDPSTKTKHVVSTGTKLPRIAKEFMLSFRIEPPKPTLLLTSELFEQFKEQSTGTLGKHTLYIYQRVFDNFNKWMPNIAVCDLSAYHFDRYKSKRSEEAAPVTVNIELRALKATLAAAVRWKLAREHPFTGCKPVRVPDVPPTFMTQKQFVSLLKATKFTWMRQILFVTVMTGMRLSEVVMLTWKRVDLELRTVSIYSSASFHAKQDRRRVNSAESNDRLAIDVYSSKKYL